MNTILSSRGFRGQPDLQSMIDLTHRLRAGGQMVYPITADLYEELADPETQVTARLWENERQELIGFIYVNSWQNLVDVFIESEFTSEIEVDLIGWAATAVQRRDRHSDPHLTLDASALESDLPRRAFLERHGFERQSDSSLLMARSLTLPIATPSLPSGFRIRPMGGEVDLEAYVTLHRAAFGTQNMTLAYRRTIMSAPGYQPELDLLAVAPDGSLAAFCVCQIFPDDRPRAGGQKEGWTDPVGTHPDYQRLGLAKALILTGMRLLQARGIDTALLATGSDNTAMQRTAEAVGFRPVSKTVWYQWRISPSPG